MGDTKFVIINFVTTFHTWIIKDKRKLIHHDLVNLFDLCIIDETHKKELQQVFSSTLSDIC
jgi:hypothetical protein